MFKNISTIILTVFCLLSCSEAKDDIPSQNPDVPPTPDANMISFSSSDSNWQEGETNTRATGLETLHKDFIVYGYKNTSNSGGQQIVMDGYKVQWDENTSNWEYILPDLNQHMKIWDFSAVSYRFFAVAPYIDYEQNSHGVTYEPSTDGTYTFTTKYDFKEQESAEKTPYFSELWYSLKGATNTSNTMPKIGEQVKLVFSPLIAKVRFLITFATGVIVTEPKFQDTRWVNTTPDTPMQWDITVKYPTITDATADSPTQEGYILATNIPQASFSLSPVTDSSTGSFLFDTPFTDDNEKWYYVPPMADAPEQYKNQSFTLTAKIDGQEDTANVPAEYMQWKAGNQYTYVFKVIEAGANLIFDGIEVEKWERNTPIGNQGHGTGGW